MYAKSMQSFLSRGNIMNIKHPALLTKYNKKFFSEEPKPMLKINYKTFIKHKKIVEDLLKVNDISDFTHLAAVNQSDLFYESLFQTLSKKYSFYQQIRIRGKTRKRTEIKIQRNFFKGRTEARGIPS